MKRILCIVISLVLVLLSAPAIAEEDWEYSSEDDLGSGSEAFQPEEQEPMSDPDTESEYAPPLEEAFPEDDVPSDFETDERQDAYDSEEETADDYDDYYEDYYDEEPDISETVTDETSATPEQRRIGNCESWVSLRAYPDTSADRLAKVPKGEIVDVYDSYAYGWLGVSYHGLNGFIPEKYLLMTDGPAEWGADEGSGIRNDLRSGDKELDRTINNCRIETWRLYSPYGEGQEQLYIVCSKGGNQIWDYLISSPGGSQYGGIHYIIGGSASSPRIIVNHMDDIDTCHLTSLDLYTGRVVWSVPSFYFVLGSGSDGTVYAGNPETTDLIAFSENGAVLWRSDCGSDEIFWIYGIEVRGSEIWAHYEHMLDEETDGYVVFSLDGKPLRYVYNGREYSVDSTGSSSVTDRNNRSGSVWLGQRVIGNCESWVSLRQYPNTSAQRLTKVSKWEYVDVYSCETPGWMTVIYHGLTGYIPEKYLLPGDNPAGNDDRYHGLSDDPYDLSAYEYRRVASHGRGSLVFQEAPRGKAIKGFKYYDGDWIFVHVSWRKEGYAMACESGVYGYVDASYIDWGTGDGSEASVAIGQEVSDNVPETVTALDEYPLDIPEQEIELTLSWERHDFTQYVGIHALECEMIYDHPVLTGNLPGIESINHLLFENLESFRDGVFGENGFRAYLREAGNDPVDPWTDTVMIHAQMGYDDIAFTSGLQYYDGHYLSLLYETVSCGGGTAVESNPRGMTFDLQTGEEVSIADLFGNTDALKRQLIDIAVGKLNASADAWALYPDFENTLAGMDPEAQSFFLTGDGELVLYFDTYELGDGAFGAPMIATGILVGD